MLFSQPEVAYFLDEHFECTWESVRPVPQLRIDFGNGRTLERTLRGNIATYVCNAEGRVLDLVPGLVDAETYVARLRESLALSRSLARVEEAHANALVAEWHQARAKAPGPPEVEKPDPSKFRVEGKLEVALGTSREASRPHQDQFALSKRFVERPIIDIALARNLPRGYGLLLDTRFAVSEGWPKAHAFLSTRTLAHVSDLTADVYRELLHVDLDDPYLGLAPDVLGGEVGRN